MRRVILMGLRGSGKSTLGRALAQRRGVGFVDLDDRTLALLGVPTASEAFSRLGEPAFRAAETRALQQALAEPDVGVIALGGGTPTAPGAEPLLRAAAQSADLIYLRCTPAELRRRLDITGGPDANRPSLTGRDPLDEITEVFNARDPLYTRLATRVLESVGSVDNGLSALETSQAPDSPAR